MQKNSCIFCSIVAQTIPAQIIAENEQCIVIKDIHPKAPIHYLIISKKHITCLQEMNIEDAPIAADLFLMARQLSQTLPQPQAFRLLMNNGADAGQSVHHIHLHFLSGKKLSDF